MTERRTPKQSAGESALDLSVLGAVSALVIPILSAKFSLPETVDSAGTAAVMAVGGSIARFIRKHRRSKR